MVCIAGYCLNVSFDSLCHIPRTKLNLGKRAFSVAAPIIWNAVYEQYYDWPWMRDLYDCPRSREIAASFYSLTLALTASSPSVLSSPWVSITWWTSHAYEPSGHCSAFSTKPCAMCWLTTMAMQTSPCRCVCMFARVCCTDPHLYTLQTCVLHEIVFKRITHRDMLKKRL